MNVDVKRAVEQLRRYVERADYAGYDPYDALNSPILRLLGAKSKWMRVGFTQCLRRCPVNLRPLLAIRKDHNPKGLGLFLWGYTKLYAVERRPDYLSAIEHLLDLLDRRKCAGYSGNCWGYNFDWQSGTYFRPRTVPTVVNTAFIGHALLDCHRVTGNPKALDLVLSTKDFILQDLNRTAAGETFCFSYTPVDQGIVHNANVLGASLLIRLGRYAVDDRIEEAALASLAYTMQRQHEDGSWYYADRQRQRWIDSFHTGFVLLALRYFLEEGTADQYRRAYAKAVRYYASRFFLADGTPKYYADRVYPIDIHSPAMAIAFFSQAGSSYRTLVDRIVTWMLSNMRDPKGYFYFRKHKHYTNKVPYMRWSQAWAFYALAEYLCQRARRPEDADETNTQEARDTRNPVESTGVL
ncbi:MAG: hypothetical protein JSW27_11315 [Phycisphaerales bacterium]|nr:MAG: hypothetical protein JSW27_11315 [Phycisphaerales bacterium]